MKKAVSLLCIAVVLILMGCVADVPGDTTAATDMPSTGNTTSAETEPTTETQAPTQSATILTETTAPAESPYHEDIMAVPMVRVMGMLYVLDKEENSLMQQLPGGYVYLGYCFEDNNGIPQVNNGSRHIPRYTEIYASPDNPDYVYYDTGEGYQRLIRAALVENEVSRRDPDNTAPESYTLAFFSTLLRVDSHNPYNQATGQEFYQPEGIDLYLLFYNGFAEWSYYNVPLTVEEEAFLAARGWGENKPMSNAERFPISAMDKRLQRFFGITFAQSWKRGLDRMTHYREENQCYYQWRSDARGDQITVSSVEFDAARNAYYITHELADTGSKYCMTLIKTDGVLQIYSNVSVK